MEFIRRFLQHVLPTGFMKVRYYGFMNPNCSVPLQKLTTLIQMAYAFALEMPDYEKNPRQLPICPNCGGTLQYLASFPSIPPPQKNPDSS
jgi:hypothetical protein